MPDSKDAKVSRKTQALSSQCSQAAQHQETAGIAQAPRYELSRGYADQFSRMGLLSSDSGQQRLKGRLLARTNRDVSHRGVLGYKWDPKGILSVTALTQMLSMALSILECLGSDFMFVANANCSSAFFHSSFLACMKAILYSTWKSRGYMKLETTPKSGTKKGSQAHTGNAVWGHSSFPSIQGIANN